jgi:hypothetical protein
MAAFHPNHLANDMLWPMERIQYKGFVIEANPRQLRDSDDWTINLTIERHFGDGVATSGYSAENTAPTREDAIARSIAMGQRVIDGLVPGCSPP